ncbi:helix-turn-helix transcriptional regulator, partial [Streptomyces sp. NPDC006655]|uniref:helix-turn-helix domain-containing protein n=1 Tax=Streptomyces sp. NPDC006655 TaxID=3156898 RepID=UPI0034527888
MGVDGAVVRLRSEADEPGWEVDPDDEWGVAVIATVGRQLKLRREAVGMRAAEFGVAVGYGEDMVYKIEGGKRIPRPEYLDRADEVLGAEGLLSAMKEDVRRVRYPKKVRDLAQLEARAGRVPCRGVADQSAVVLVALGSSGALSGSSAG